ncbi:MAG: serine hydrolase [Bacteroidetes bacterium]|nr:serine hydrolase [Bacteroidota bacterium]
MRVKFYSLLMFFWVCNSLFAQSPEFLNSENKWVDSVFNSLTPKEKIAQLFMVAAYSNKDIKHVKEIKNLIENFKIGGLIWMQGGPAKQAKLANYYQKITKTPLLYSIDGEWGLAMRLDSTPRYPKQMTLGAIQNDSLIYLMGKQIAQECKRAGIHVNFAPDIDINNNSLNPVIGMRSFGEDKLKVAQKGYMYMRGLQDEHVMANGKHFPGHGDTDSDSHKTLPQINHSVQRLDSLELYPFKQLIEKGLASIMVAHLNIPALDTTANLPSTLSPKIVNDLLKIKLNFKGLIFTDALNMKGVAKYFEPGIADVKALLAGNDVLLFSGNVEKAINEILKAIDEKKITQLEIDERCKKIIKAKYWCGLNKNTEVASRNIAKELNTQTSYELNEKLASAAITVLKNNENFLPLKNTKSLKITEISFGIEEKNTFYNTLATNLNVQHIGLKHDAKDKEIETLFKIVNTCDLAIIQVNKTTLKADNFYGIGEQTLKLIDSIATLKPTVLSVFSNPYLLNHITSISKVKALILGYEYMPSLLRASANVILGLNNADGKLPVSTINFKLNSGFNINALMPQVVVKQKMQFDSIKFRLIDSIAIAGITEKVYPGCQIVALKDGDLIYRKSFGRYTYDALSNEINNQSMYDLASLTKILSSALALMKLQNDKKFDYKKTLGFYLPQLKGSNKDSLVIEDVLTHQAGLQPWLAFYLNTITKKGTYKPGYYSATATGEYTVQVAKNLFTASRIRDSIYKKIIDSKIEKTGKYVYSDLGYYFMQEIIEKLSGKKQNELLADLYRKLGISLTYLPLKFFSEEQIVPTENDKKFRKQIIQGFVHDPGAAMLGGVAGHAGLFGNAYEVAKLMQLYLNNGMYNNEQVIDSNIVKDFVKCHYCKENRRGLCFDKPETDDKKMSPVTSECSFESFGHSGFTGTFAWADPKNNLVFVFLSNRVYPDAEPNKLSKSGIRSKIHKAFYDACK